MQQAYYSESALAGGWTLIGYTAPGNTGLDQSETTNFKYGKGEINMDNSTAIGANAKTGWTAMNLKDLNDCKIASATANWTVKVSDNGSLAFDAAANGAGCVALTPTFGNIGK